MIMSSLFMVAMEYGLCRSGLGGGSPRLPTFGYLRSRKARPDVGPGGGKRTALGDQEPVGGDTEGGMMVKPPPASALKMTQADFLFEFLVVAFNAPPQLGRSYQLFKCYVCVKAGEPIFCGFWFSLGPLDQQPFFRGAVATPIIMMPFVNPHGGKSRREYLVAAFPPGDGLICVIG